MAREKDKHSDSDKSSDQHQESFTYDKTYQDQPRDDERVLEIGLGDRPTSPPPKPDRDESEDSSSS